MNEDKDWFISRSSWRENSKALGWNITGGIVVHVNNILMSSNGLKRTGGAA